MMVTAAGEKAKLVAVMVTVAVGGVVVAVVATAVVVVVSVVVVAARVVVVVGARDVVVDGIVVVGAWVAVVVEAVVVVALVVEGDAVVEVRDGAVVADVVNVTSRESSVTPLAQAARNNAKTSSWLRRILVIRMEHDDRFSSGTVTPDRVSPRAQQGDRRRSQPVAREKAPASGGLCA